LSFPFSVFASVVESALAATGAVDVLAAAAVAQVALSDLASAACSTAGTDSATHNNEPAQKFFVIVLPL